MTVVFSAGDGNQFSIEVACEEEILIDVTGIDAAVNFGSKLIFDQSTQTIVLPKFEDSIAAAGGNGSPSRDYTVTANYNLRGPWSSDI